MKSLQESHVIVVADLFRLVDTSTPDLIVWHQQPNARWIAELARAALSSCANIKVGILNHHALGLTRESFGPSPGQSADEWWITMLDRPVEDALAERIRSIIRGKVVIMFEVPDNLKALIADTATTFIETEVAPIRFLDDLLLSAASPDPQISAALAREEVTSREMAWQCGLLRSQLNASPLALPDGANRVALLAGQTPADRSLIDEGRFLSWADYAEEIRTLAEQHDLVLLTPHPHMAGNVPSDTALLSIPGIRMTNINSYRLLASGVITTVAAISSSLLEESIYFGVPSTRFARRPHRAHYMIRAQSFGGQIAERIAELCDFALPPLSGACLPAGPVLQQLIGFNWAIGRADHNPNGLLPGLLLASDHAQTLLPRHPDMAAAFVYGWHGPEDWGVWAGPISVLSMRWPADQHQPLVCVLELTGFATNDRHQQIELWTEGRCIGSFTISRHQTSKIAIQLSPPIRPGPIHLWLSTEAQRPSDHDASSGDERLIGMGLISLSWMNLYQ
ncbi:MAG: hypothetical protein QM690_12395 [Sphingobium sp.]